MSSQLLQQALHVDNDPIVKDVHVAFSVKVFGGFLFKLPLDMLFNFLATLVLCLTVDLKNCIHGLLDGLLVTFLSDFDDLTNDNVLQPIFKKVSAGPILFDILVLDDLLLSALLELANLVIWHLETLLVGVLAFQLGNFLSELFLAPRKQLLPRVFDQLVCDLFRQRHYVIQRDSLGVFDNL